MSSLPRHLDLKAGILLVLLCASWGLQQISNKIAVEGVPPALQGGIRSAGALILLYLWMVARREKLVANDGCFWWGLAVGLLFSVEFLLIYWGLEFTCASRSVIFLYTMPFFTALGAHWFIPGEKLQKMQVAGLLCAFLGILAAFSESVELPQVFIGDAMLLLAAVLWAMVTVIIKAGPLAGIRASRVLFYQLAVSAVALPLGAVLMGQDQITKMTPLIFGCMAYQVIWVAFITYLAWFWLVRNYPASLLSAFLFLTPLFGVMEGAILLDESVSLRLIAAMMMVCVGIYVVNRPQHGG